MRPGRDRQAGAHDAVAEARIPFWRNVKTIGILAQVVFVLLIVAGIGVLLNNVTTALRVSNLPADFSFLSRPAGIPIAERPLPYEVTDSYAKALLIGFLNTLKVAVVGVVLASFIGVLVGVMRLSSNWLVKGIATVYVELLRNIPLAVQIVFWYAAILLPFPPRISNPIALPGGILFSNIGLAFASFYPTYRFGAWLPWLIAAVVLAIAAAMLRRRDLRRRDTVGPVWHVPLLTFVAIAGVGYVVSSLDRSVPPELQLEFDVARGRGTVNFVSDLGADPEPAAFVPVRIGLDAGQLTTTTQNLVESREQVNATFRFPLIRPTEADEVTVDFADPEAAESAGYSLHFLSFPSSGIVYVDQDGDGEFDRGENVNPATGTGYNGVQLVMTVTGFERVVVGDREGQVRTPLFRPITGAAEAEAAPAAGRGRFSAFGPPAVSQTEAPAALEATSEVLPVGPLVYSRVHIPISNYEGGARLTVNYLALLLALVVYTSAFIGEIVRGGIQAVAKGQREAANALGLSGYQTFSLVVFPQALRIVLPPVISQYLNLTKNSSLATLAGYAELFVIANVVSNQTGAAIPIAILLIGAYLTISLAFSVVLNKVNASLALVER